MALKNSIHNKGTKRSENRHIFKLPIEIVISQKKEGVFYISHIILSKITAIQKGFVLFKNVIWYDLIVT